MPSEADRSIYEVTQKRLSAIQSHFQKVDEGGRLKGKVCIVTGVGSPKGIGRASALLFARERAKALYLLDFDGDELPALGKDLNKRFPQTKTVCIQGDAADEALIKTLCDRALEEHGSLDVFFANAGIANPTALDNTDVDDFQNTLRINTISVFLACNIILTASVAGIRSGGGPPDYSASKSAVMSLAATTAWQLYGTGIRCNAICPGLIETNMTVAAFEMAKSRGTQSKIGQLNPMRRYGVSEEIAYAVLFLASDESSYVNGISLPVDGGLSASLPVPPGRPY